jgi:signal transduction histidine kinase
MPAAALVRGAAVKGNDCEGCRRGIVDVLSHELRNPLAALRNSLYVLTSSQPGSAKAQRAMAVMERQIGRVSLLITSLTDVARINQGKIELRRALVDLCEALRHAAEDCEHLFASREVRLCVELPNQPVWVWADAVRLEQIVGNLLDNAARFTPAGGRVTLAAECDGTARCARIRVRDSGVGLDAALRENLFEPFVQADTSLARSHGGLGLGLVVVKGLTELHSGRVWAESAGLGLGSLFTVELPLASEPHDGLAPP